MSLETFALINSEDQVVNHIVRNKDDVNFESNMAEQLVHWSCVRYVETTEEQPVIILDESPTIWTTHSEATGFVLPEGYNPTLLVESNIIFTPDEEEVKREKVIINGRTYPADSLLIKENAPDRPEGWVLPKGEEEVSLNNPE